MMKKMNLLVVIALFLIVVPIQTSAASLVKEYIPPPESDFYKKRYTLWIAVDKDSEWVDRKQIIREGKNPISYSGRASLAGQYLTLPEYPDKRIFQINLGCQGPRLELEFLNKDRYLIVDTFTYEKQGLIDNAISGCSVTTAFQGSFFLMDENRYEDDTFGDPPSPEPEPDPTPEPDPPEELDPSPGETPRSEGFFDWDFFWGMFGFFLKIIAPFIMLIIAIIAVGILLKNVIASVRERN